MIYRIHNIGNNFVSKFDTIMAKVGICAFNVHNVHIWIGSGHAPKAGGTQCT